MYIYLNTNYDTDLVFFSSEVEIGEGAEGEGGEGGEGKGDEEKTDEGGEKNEGNFFVICMIMFDIQTSGYVEHVYNPKEEAQF